MRGGKLELDDMKPIVSKYSHAILHRLPFQANRSGTKGFRAPEIMLKYANQTTGKYANLLLTYTILNIIS